jgi:hypothetical protein
MEVQMMRSQYTEASQPERPINPGHSDYRRFDMTLKEVSHHPKPQAQQIMFNRAREQEHHELKRLETGWSYLLRDMVTDIGMGHSRDFYHLSGSYVGARARKAKTGILVIQSVRIRPAEGYTTVDRPWIPIVRSRTNHSLCIIDE